MNADYIYTAVKEVFADTSVIYEEYIIYLVGFEGLYTLIENGLIENDGVINGRRSYVLCDKNLN